MNACDLSRLAWTQQAQLPDLCIRDTVGDPLLQNAVADRCMATCRQAGVADEDARVIGEALAGYLYGWRGRNADLEARVSHAQAALNLGAGGSGEPVCRSGRPARCSRLGRSPGWWQRPWTWITRAPDGQAHRVITSPPWNRSGHDPHLVHSHLQPLGVPRAVGLVRIAAVN